MPFRLEAWTHASVISVISVRFTNNAAAIADMYDMHCDCMSLLAYTI